MEITTIPYSETLHFSDTVEKYLNQESGLSAFYSVFPQKNSLLKHAENKEFSEVQRALLCTILNEQHAGEMSPEQLENIKNLEDKNCFTVTTGHQICLFGGPLYFFLKIISAINLSRELNKNEQGKKFVPLFWMATEDHDFEEVNHIQLFGKKIEWKRAFGEHVGDMRMSSIEGFKEELFEILGDSEFAKELKSLFNKAYTSENSFSEATRTFVNYFFSAYGLLILDANDPKLKASFETIMKSDVEENSTFNIVSETNKKLKEIIKIQAKPSEVNLFYLDPKKRLKILRNKKEYHVGGEVFSANDLTKKINLNPSGFSPNVILRPLYQESILPNVAYVGGGGEIAYWLELKDLFDLHHIQFPSLVLRNSLLWIDKANSKKLVNLNLAPIDLFQREEDLLNQFSKTLLSEDENLNEEKEKINLLFSEVKTKLTDIDPTLETSVEGEKQKVLKALDKLESKILRSAKTKNEVQLKQVKSLKNKLFPNASLQERNENFAQIYLKHGMNFIEILLDNLDPLSFEFTIIKEPT